MATSGTIETLGLVLDGSSRDLGSVGYGVLPPRDAMPRARAAAMNALEIDETMAQAQIRASAVHGVCLRGL